MLKKNIYYLGPAFISIITIFILSSFSKLPGPDIGDIDKLEHFIAYLIISLLFYRALLGTTTYSEKKCIILAITITLLYGISDEFHQSFVPGRDAGIKDLIFDLLGAILAYGNLFKKIREAIINDCRMPKM